MSSGRWSNYRPESSGRFVNKEEWATEGVVFTITEIEETSSNDRYGEQWLLHVTPEGGEEKILSFTKGSGGRDEAIEAAANDLEAGNVTSIGPLVLVKVRTKQGRPFFTIEDADDEDDDDTTTNTPFRAEPDDDLPF